MPMFRAFCGVVLVAVLASSAQAQAPAAQGQKPSMEELLQRIDALQRHAAEGDKLINKLQHRVDELESRDKHRKSQTTTARREPAGQKPAQVAVGYPQVVSTAGVVVTPSPVVTAAFPALRPPEPMGSQDEGEGQDALRSDLPGLSLRIPGSQSEVRFYGFANVHGYRDFNGRNQSDAPTVQTIPLAGSPADLQGGDFGLSAQRTSAWTMAAWLFIP